MTGLKGYGKTPIERVALAASSVRRPKRDYYEMLGVPETADGEQISRAFRRLARDLHPDVSDSPAAEERFREVSAAYSALSKPRSRFLYDKFGFRGRGAGFEDGHFPGAPSVLGISWPAGKARVAWTEDTTPFWGGKIAPEAAQITWRAGQPAIKIAFLPAGAGSGMRPVQPPGPLAPATVMLVWPDPHALRRCLPGPQTTGQVVYDAGTGQPGAFVTGTAEAKDLACSDGTTVSVAAKFKLVILDVR